MKRLILFLFLISLSGIALAQNQETGATDSTHQQVPVDGYGRNVVDGTDIYYRQPFTPQMGYSVYGSRYRKARYTKGWGIALATVVAPLGGVWFAYGIKEHSTPGKVIGAGLCLAGLGAGIPLWVKGQRELDWMMDDYARRYGPKPHTASLSFGPTANGTGLALRF
jgi:hypothetical protein